MTTAREFRRDTLAAIERNRKRLADDIQTCRDWLETQIYREAQDGRFTLTVWIDKLPVIQSQVVTEHLMRDLILDGFTVTLSSYLDTLRVDWSAE